MIQKDKKIQLKWIKIIPRILYIPTKKNNILFLKYKHISHFILDWNKLWFYLYYQLNLLKNNLNYSHKLLFTSDFAHCKNEIKIIAKTTNSFFAIGPWKGGILSNIYWYRFLPTFIINLGMFYPKTYFQELKNISIPNIFFLTTRINQFKNTTLTYPIFLFSKNKYIQHYLSFFIIYIIKNLFYNYEKLLLKKYIKTEKQYIHYLRRIKKNKITFLEQNFKYLYLQSTNWNIYFNKNKSIIFKSFLTTTLLNFHFKKYIEVFENIILNIRPLFIKNIQMKQFFNKKKNQKQQILLTNLYTYTNQLILNNNIKNPIFFKNINTIWLKKKINNWITTQYF